MYGTLILPANGMRRAFIIAGIIIAVSTAAAGQYFEEGYRTAIGVRLYPGALSVKHFFQAPSAVEGLVFFRNVGTRVTGLYERHFYLGNLEGLTWYIGGGAHAEFLKRNSHDNSEHSNPTIGLDAIAGVDYKVISIPLNISLDWQPSKTFINENYTNADWVSLTVRYAF